MAEKFYVTTAISYPNGVPHIGHAYEAIATDVIARFERLDGKDVFFLTGTDEHGLKMKQTADREGITPRELADRNAARFIDMAQVLGLSNDDFIRTTEARHYEACSELWRRMEKAGDIFKRMYGGWYSVRDETYYKESETEVRDGARVAIASGTPVEWNEEETYFFRLSAYQDKLLAHYAANPEFILPLERRNEVVSFVKMGLEDLSISRTTLDWGIPVPDAPGHVMYVWIDALNNYVTATGLLTEPNGPRAHYWPADVHVIGKDIVRFHAVYWPAFLMSAGLALPKRIFGHGFVLNKGEKMSKSVGNVVDPFDLVKAYGREPVRYFFMREVMFGQDGNYTPEAIVNRINADLANNLGNLAQRSLSMIFKNCGGAIPEPGTFTAEDQAILDCNRRALCGGARRDGSPERHEVPRCRLERRRRGQPLLRGGRAVGEKEDRPGKDGDDPLRHRRVRASVRNSCAAGDARMCGEVTRPACGRAGRPHIREPWQRGTSDARNTDPRTAGRLPTLRRSGRSGQRAARRTGQAEE